MAVSLWLTHYYKVKIKNNYLEAKNKKFTLESEFYYLIFAYGRIEMFGVVSISPSELMVAALSLHINTARLPDLLLRIKAKS